MENELIYFDCTKPSNRNDSLLGVSQSNQKSSIFVFHRTGTTARVLWSLDCNDLAGVVEVAQAKYCPGNFSLNDTCPGENHSLRYLLFW